MALPPPPAPPQAVVAVADPPKTDWINAVLITLVVGLSAYAALILGLPGWSIMATVSTTAFVLAVANLIVKNLVYAAFWLAAGFFLPAGAVIALLS